MKFGSFELKRNTKTSSKSNNVLDGIPTSQIQQQYTLPGMLSRTAYDNGFASISAISDEVLKRNIHLGDIRDPEKDVTEKFAFWNAFSRPNDRMGYMQFIDVLVAGFLSLPELNLLVWHVDGDRAKPGVPFKENEDSFFDLENIGGFTILPNSCKSTDSEGYEEWEIDLGSACGGLQKFKRNSVITLKYSLLPDDGFSGVSPGSASTQEAAIRDRLNQFQRALFDNGATPSIIVTIHARTDEEYQAIQKSYEERNRGAAKSGGVIYQKVIDDPIQGMSQPHIEITVVGTPNNNLAISEIVEFTNTTIVSNYGVSPIIYGDATTTTFQNQNLADAKFMDRVQAILVRLCGAFENELARIANVLELPFTFVWDDAALEVAEEQKIKAQTKTEQVRAFIGLVQSGATPAQAATVLELGDDWKTIDVIEIPASDADPEPLRLNLYEDKCTCEHHNNDISDRISEKEKPAQKKILNLLEAIAKEIFDGLKTNKTRRLSALDRELIDELIAVMQQGADVTGAALLDEADIGRLLTDFGGLSQQAVRQLEKRTTKVITNYVDFVTDKINGLADDDPAKKVFTDFYTNHSRHRAKLIAQQETKNAYQNGELDLANNIDRWLRKNRPQTYIVKTWETTSDSPCRFCKSMEGKEAGIQDSFVPSGLLESEDVTLRLDPNYTDGSIPDAHANCVIGDTNVLAPGLENIQRAYYSGSIVKITTAKGRSLSVTPNHIVLTSRGWVAAKNLTKFDSVISYNVGEETVSEVNPNNDKSPASIEQIFRAFVESGGMATVSVPASTEEFKGDGISVQGNIDVVSADSLLGSNIDVPLLECFDNLKFADANISTESSFVSSSDLSSMLFALTLASDSIMSFDRLSSMLSRGELTREKFIGLFDISDYDFRLKKATADDVSADVVGLRDALLGFSGIISADDVVDVEVANYSGHVYDLSTASTSYIANSIISSNCQCVFKFKLVNKGS